MTREMRVMKKILAGVIIAGALVGCTDKAEEKVSSEGVIKIGISQIVEHPSLDQIRQGVEDAVNESQFGERVVFDFQNAQGDFVTAQSIAEQFNRSADMMVAITTPSAQAAQNKVSDKPVFFTGVTNPQGAGLNAENVTGISDMSPVDEQVRMITELLPEAHRIGTVYNTGEANSVFLTEEFTKAAEKQGLEVVARGVTNVNEVAAAMDTFRGDVDVIYTTKDNTVASAYSLIVNKADEGNIPVIGATRDFTEMGALASAGTSEYDAGYQTGEMIVRYLAGEKMANLPIESVDNIEMTVNSQKAEKYNINTDDMEKKGIKVIN